MRVLEEVAELQHVRLVLARLEEIDFLLHAPTQAPDGGRLCVRVARRAVLEAGGQRASLLDHFHSELIAARAMHARAHLGERPAAQHIARHLVELCRGQKYRANTRSRLPLQSPLVLVHAYKRSKFKANEDTTLKRSYF